MIASHTPPKKDHRKPPPLNGGSANGKPLSNPSLSVPMGAGPTPDENVSSSDSMGSGEALASREASGPPTIRLHPRFRNSKEDERDDTQGAKDRRSSKPVCLAGESAIGRVEKRPFVAPRQQPPALAPRRASWSSWTAASNGSQVRGGPTWRLHFRTDSDDVATAGPPAGVTATSALRFHTASSLPSTRETGTELQSAASLSESEYQRLLHQHSQHAVQHRRPSVRPASVPAGSSSIATRHYSSWQQWSGQPGLAIGGRNFVQQSRARSGPLPQVYTSVRPQMPDLHGPPYYAHVHSTFVGRTPPKSSTGPSVEDGARSHPMPADSNKALPSKHVLSPDHQRHSTPLFKKARGFDKLDLLCSATLEIGELHDNPTGCSCPKSKCVALYCDCFKAGRRCNASQCSCLDWYVWKFCRCICFSLFYICTLLTLSVSASSLSRIF